MVFYYYEIAHISNEILTTKSTFFSDKNNIKGKKKKKWLKYMVRESIMLKSNGSFLKDEQDATSYNSVNNKINIYLFI